MDKVEAAIEGGAISFFPNPTTSVVNIHFDNTEMKTEEVRILSNRGRILYRQEDIRGNFELPFTGFAPGAYFIWLRVEGKTERFQVIKN